MKSVGRREFLGGALLRGAALLTTACRRLPNEVSFERHDKLKHIGHSRELKL